MAAAGEGTEAKHVHRGRSSLDSTGRWEWRKSRAGVAHLVALLPQSKRSLVRFLIRAHAWVAGLIPGQGKRQAIDVSLSLPLPRNLPLSLKKKKEKKRSWLLWLSELSSDLQTKGSPVRFPVRAHAWVVGQVPSRGHVRGNHTLMFSYLLSLPSLKIHTLNLKKKKFHSTKLLTTKIL